MSGAGLIVAVFADVAAGKIFITGGVAKLIVKRPAQSRPDFGIAAPEFAKAAYRLEKVFGRDDLRVGFDFAFGKGVIIGFPDLLAAVVDEDHPNLPDGLKPQHPAVFKTLFSDIDRAFGDGWKDGRLGRRRAGIDCKTLGLSWRCGYDDFDGDHAGNHNDGLRRRRRLAGR